MGVGKMCSRMPVTCPRDMDLVGVTRLMRVAGFAAPDQLRVERDEVSDVSPAGTFRCGGW